MSLRGLIILVAIWAVVLLIVASPAGALPGFLLGITVAFFIGPAVSLLGIPGAGLAPIAWTLAALYALFVIFLAGLGARAWQTGDKTGARGMWGGAISLSAIALAAKLSTDSLVAAWP